MTKPKSKKKVGKAKAKASKAKSDVKATSTRPRQHILEKLSKRAFSSALPEHMVDRDLPEDYGVDFEVELFDAEGDRTGLTFKVQLKSTDAKSAKRSLRLSDFDYWSQLDVPVLLVLYMARTDELLSTWAHAHNPWPAPEGKTTTVTFSTPLSEQLERASDDLERIREVRASVLRGPVTVGVAGDDTAITLKTRHVLRAAVDRFGLKRHLQVVSGEQAHALIAWREEMVAVTGPAGMASMTLHDMEFDDFEEVVADVLVGVSVLLLQLGSDQVAAGVLAGVRGDVSSSAAEGLAVPMATVFAAAHRWVELSALVAAAPSTTSAEDAFSVAVMAKSAMDDAAARTFVEQGRTFAQDLSTDGERDLAARWLMLATFIAFEHLLWPEADAMLTEMPTLTRRFVKDEMFHQLSGKAKWQLGEFDEALSFYRKAWRFGWRTDQAVAALGEALISAGFYTQARDHLSAAAPETMTRWALLMLVAVEDIIELTGVECQRRSDVADVRDDVDDVEDPDELMALLRDHDALNAAVLDKYMEVTEEVAFGAVVWVATIAESEWHWIRAVLLSEALEVGEPLQRAIVQEAALEVPDFIATLRAMQESVETPLPDGFLERIAGFADAAAPYEGPPSFAFSPEDMLRPR